MSRKCSFRIWLHTHCHFLKIKCVPQLSPATFLTLPARSCGRDEGGYDSPQNRPTILSRSRPCAACAHILYVATFNVCRIKTSSKLTYVDTAISVWFCLRQLDYMSVQRNRHHPSLMLRQKDSAQKYTYKT